jgi:hypothetical protein
MEALHFAHSEKMVKSLPTSSSGGLKVKIQFRTKEFPDDLGFRTHCDLMERA